jgi:2,4-dienoyl-CoA reductase-like NADH-dependent reductase (Old Yellow Enzyme family)
MEKAHEPLFEPVRIGKTELPNRVALAPTYVGMGGPGGMMTDQALCYYFLRASTGLGLVVVEATGVTARYAFHPNYGLSAASDMHIAGLRDLARVIHWAGSKAVLQLLPGQGAQAFYPWGKRELVGPSDVPAVTPKGRLPGVLSGLSSMSPQSPRPLSEDEIHELKEQCIRAAMRAKEAGFDGVEIHGAHGYLLAQFTSPYFNRRNDRYGGSPEGRRRLSVELIQGIREKTGDGFMIGYRMSAREGIEGGMELEEAKGLALALREAGIDYLSVSQGCYGALLGIFPKEEGALLEAAATLKRKVDVLVMCANIHSPRLAASAVKEGHVDVVALSRALMADPLWLEKVREGRAEEIQPCIRCYNCIGDLLVRHLPIRCRVNPWLGFERFNPRALPRPPQH